MGGFKLPERTARIDFSQSDYAGAEVYVTLKIKIGTFREWEQIRADADIDSVADIILTLVKSWNLEDEDGPIPLTRDGIDRIDDLAFLLAIMDGWRGAIAGVTEVEADLKAPSSNGITSTEENLADYLPV